MLLKISNCNNIDSGEVEIIENILNIKYAINGTGKSTIAKCMDLSVNNPDNLTELIPFKYRDQEITEDHKPKIEGFENINSVLVFNETYIRTIAFKQEELVANSFEIFVKTPDYEQRMLQIEQLIEDIRKTFNDSEELVAVISDLSSFIDSFGKAKSGYSGSSVLAKGLGTGNKIENIPEGLESYSDFIRSDKRVPWLGWQMKGLEYSELSDNCPFCTESVSKKKETIRQIKEKYHPKSIEHLNNIINTINNLKPYFSSDAIQRFDKITVKAGNLLDEEINYLIRVKDQAIDLKDKLSNLKAISFFKFKDVEKIVDLFTQFKIKLEFLPDLDSEKTSAIVNNVNTALDSIIEKAGLLQGEVNQQKISIERTIENYSEQINSFLKNAGYKYYVTDMTPKKRTHLRN
ncbi:MAG: hypothetical protein ABUK01_15100 [Leptospirales bacterium]